MNERYEQRPKPKDVETLKNLISKEDLREQFTIPPTPSQEKKEEIIERTITRIAEEIKLEGLEIDNELLLIIKKLTTKRVEFIATLLEELNKKAEHQKQSEIFDDVTPSQIESAVDIETIS